MTLLKNAALLSSLLAIFSLGACATDTMDGDLPFEGDADGFGKADHTELDFTPLLNASASQDRRHQGGKAIITSRQAWQDYFGTYAPAEVDFSKEWVAFYGAGSRNTGGYGASITSLAQLPGQGLILETQHSSPGIDCIVTQAFTTPHMIVKFDIPSPTPRWAVSDHEDIVTRCGPSNADRQVELAASLEVWEAKRDEISNTYTYSQEFNSVFSNISTRTTLVVEFGEVVARHGKSQAGADVDVFSEFGDDVGTRDGYHAPRLLDALYEECKNDILTVDEDENFMHLSFDDNGLLQACTFFNRNCQDDCTRGPRISELDLETGPQN